MTNEAVVSDPPFEYVIHTASPFVTSFADAEQDILRPAIDGTVGLLQAVKKFAPTVRRVVILSSFASMINPATAGQGALVDDTMWNPVTWEDAKTDARFTYAGSKVRCSRTIASHKAPRWMY